MQKSKPNIKMRDWEWCTSRYLDLPEEILEALEDSALYEEFLLGLDLGRIFYNPKRPLLPKGLMLKGQFKSRAVETLDKIEKNLKLEGGGRSAKEFVLLYYWLNRAGFDTLGILAVMSYRSAKNEFHRAMWDYYVRALIYCATVKEDARPLFLGLNILWLHKVIRVDGVNNRNPVRQRLPLWICCGLCKELGRPDLARLLWNRSPLESGPGGAFLLDRLEVRTPLVLRILLHPEELTGAKVSGDSEEDITEKLNTIEMTIKNGFDEHETKMTEKFQETSEIQEKYEEMRRSENAETMEVIKNVESGLGEIKRTTGDIQKGVVGVEENQEAFTEHFDKKVDTLGEEHLRLKEENEKLKGDLAAMLSHIAKEVEPEYFLWIFVTLSKGSPYAAANALGIGKTKFYVELKAYANRGGLYQTLYKLIDIRNQGAGKKDSEAFNDEWLAHQGGQDVSSTDSLKEMLECLESMSAENWESMRDELVELLSEELP